MTRSLTSSPFLLLFHWLAPAALVYFSFYLPITFGGAIELIQPSFNRSADVNDWIADIIGSFVCCGLFTANYVKISTFFQLRQTSNNFKLSLVRSFKLFRFNTYKALKAFTDCIHAIFD